MLCLHSYCPFLMPNTAVFGSPVSSSALGRRIVALLATPARFRASGWISISVNAVILPATINAATGAKPLISLGKVLLAKPNKTSEKVGLVVYVICGSTSENTSPDLTLAKTYHIT
ncbi:hypothetical protein ASSaV_gp22 [Abalone shriveling syndrome-associated virus]|uniref:hypothetical protein n=1 Tax=Abalone shriveling syndrome-associated virus TaxID=491893 RepID=UPI0001881BAE|nr:hypothetical protein ASSaV_gp22 [Abalone shriveling syndrome-associated virus]ACJ71983.1 unknown [Abalone shriveling syndrome-associated virus]